MATRKDLQKWLNRFPEETIIEFVVQQNARMYRDCKYIDFDTPTLSDKNDGDGWEFNDFRNNKFVENEDEHLGKCYLKLGNLG